MGVRGGPGRLWHRARRGLRGKRAWVWAAALLGALVVFPFLARAYQALYHRLWERNP